MECCIRRVVLVGSDRGLGDTILMTPVFRALREVLPNAYLEAWVNPRWRCVTDGSPHLDYIRSAPFRPRRLAFLKLFTTLKRCSPDAVLILVHSLRFARMAWLARVPVRAGRIDEINKMNSGSLARLLTHRAWLQPSMHRVDHNLSVAETMLDRLLPRYPLLLMPMCLGSLPSQLSHLPKGCYAVVHMGTGGTQPRWLTEYFAYVGSYLRQRYGLVPVISGAAQDLPIGEQCERLIGSFCINLVSKLSILDLAEVLRGAKMLISVDTGVVHLAASVGTPCVTLYPRKDNPPHRWRPWMVPSELVVPMEYCAHCTEHECRIAAFPPRCVTSLLPEQVCRAIDRLFQKCASVP